MTGRDRSHGYAATAPDAPEPALRSRTYAVPFEDVWQAALALAGGRLRGFRGWAVASADDHDGVIGATARGALSGEHDIDIRIGLDADAQTFVDVEVVARRGPDLGRSRRRLLRFLRSLDAMAAQPRRPASRSQ